MPSRRHCASHIIILVNMFNDRLSKKSNPVPENSSSEPVPIFPSGDPQLPATDVEKQEDEGPSTRVSAFKSLGLLDRFLALWIFLAMAIGIILGNFVANTGPALQKGKFVGVSVPIGSITSC